MLKAWIEAMRLRTLPVSLAGVIAAIALAVSYQHTLLVWPACLCVAFALLAQIASNFANEYYDYKAGLDKPGREGPRRGVTEGDIKPKSMLHATYFTLGLACAIGLSLIYWGGWWLIAAGIAIAVGALMYSTGPYPLSRHALGEVAVFMFFGIIPVNLTFYLQTGTFDIVTFGVSASIGLMAANVLLINNYRDIFDDASVGKYTLAVAMGHKFTSNLYLIDGYMAIALSTWYWVEKPTWCLAFPAAYLIVHTLLWIKMQQKSGHSLNPMLGLTALLMLIYSISLFC